MMHLALLLLLVASAESSLLRSSHAARAAATARLNKGVDDLAYALGKMIPMRGQPLPVMFMSAQDQLRRQADLLGEEDDRYGELLNRYVGRAPPAVIVLPFDGVLG